MRRFAPLSLVIALTACGETPTTTPADDGGTGEMDARPTDAPTAGDAGPGCASDDECDNDTFCNGVEQCLPGTAGADARGCVAGEPPCEAGDTCDEPSDRCEAGGCGTMAEADADGDGVRS